MVGLTCSSVRRREEASRHLSVPTMYCCRANSFSSRASWSLVKMVRTRLALPFLALKMGKQHLEIRKPGGKGDRWGQGGEEPLEGVPFSVGSPFEGPFLERQKGSSHVEVSPLERQKWSLWRGSPI